MSSTSPNISRLGPRPRALSLRLRSLAGLGIVAGLVAAQVYFARAVRPGAPEEVQAIVLERRLERPGEDREMTIDLIASEMLSPASVQVAIRDRFASGTALSDQELAEMTQQWRNQLQVDVSPGEEKQPWRIAVRARCALGSPQACAMVNALADRYRQTRAAARMAAAAETLQKAHAAAASARREELRLRQDLDRRVEELIELQQELATDSARVARQANQGKAEGAEAAARAASSDPDRRRELAQLLAELEARRSALLERLLPAHPDVQAVDEEIAAARAQFDRLPPVARAPVAEASDSAGKAPESPSPPQATPGGRVAKVSADIRAQRATLAQIGFRLAQCNSAEVAAAERLTRAATEHPLHVIPAIVPSPAPAQTGTEAALLGLLAATAGWLLATGRGPRSGTFRNIDEIEQSLGLPVIAVLPLEEERENPACDAGGGAFVRRAAG